MTTSVGLFIAAVFLSIYRSGNSIPEGLPYMDYHVPYEKAEDFRARYVDLQLLIIVKAEGDESA